MPNRIARGILSIVAAGWTCVGHCFREPSSDVQAFVRLPRKEQKVQFADLDAARQLSVAYWFYWNEPRDVWFVDMIAAETHLLPFLTKRLEESTDEGEIEMIAYILQHMSARYVDIVERSPVLAILEGKSRTMRNDGLKYQVQAWIAQIRVSHDEIWSSHRQQ